MTAIFGLILGAAAAVMTPKNLAAPNVVPPSGGPVEFIGQIVMPAGAPNGSVQILKVPKGFYLVVQTVSFFRSNVVAGSVGQIFVQNTYHRVQGYEAVPSATADGSIYPSATLSATFYCDQYSPVIVNAYRSGSDAAQEMDNIIISGTYVPIPAS